MIKTIIFDLDGVLVEAKKLHYDCLNDALREEDPKFIIEWNEEIFFSWILLGSLVSIQVIGYQLRVYSHSRNASKSWNLANLLKSST